MVKPALIGTVGLNFLKIVDVSGVSPIDSAASIYALVYVASIFPR